MSLCHSRAAGPAGASLTGAGLRVAECLLRVQPQADVAAVGWGWVRARAGPHVVSAAARR